jgi:uncharacterized protein YndB with AHSA1/START domain
MARSGDELKLEMRHLFDATPEELFNAWLDPRQLSSWIGPKGVRATVQLLEPRVGRRYRIGMRTPDGANPTVAGVYRELERFSRLAFTWTWEHEKHETLVALGFEVIGKQTEMTLLHERFASAERRESHRFGWSGSLERLSEALAAR